MLKFKNLKKKYYYYYYLVKLPFRFTKSTIFFFFFLEREFEPMASAPDDSSLSLDQDTNQFLV